MHFLQFSGALFSFTEAGWEAYLREVAIHIAANTTPDGRVHSLLVPSAFGGKLRTSLLLDESSLVLHHENLLSPQAATPTFRVLHAENIPKSVLRG